ncbi:MAG: hypothetical protein WC781_05550 [Candidatus Pacearchaeota archaeon]|jgi:chromosome segregation ATPase
MVEGTFNDVWKRNFEEYEKENDNDITYNIAWKDLREFKQLHDKDITGKNEELENLKDKIIFLEKELDMDCDERVKKQLQEKDTQIQHLKEDYCVKNDECDSLRFNLNIYKQKIRSVIEKAKQKHADKSDMLNEIHCGAECFSDLCCFKNTMKFIEKELNQ